VRRDADPDDIGNGPRNLLATPARRAFALALNGTYVLSHLADAPARETVIVLFAGVEKATFARFALWFFLLVDGLEVKVDFVGNGKVHRDIDSALNIRRVRRAVCGMHDVGRLNKVFKDVVDSTATRDLNKDCDNDQ